MKIYVASSWKNGRYYPLLEWLRMSGHEPLDWRMDGGFAWEHITGIPGEDVGGPNTYRDYILPHPIAVTGFNNDFDKMREADACVLLLPCGRSAHLEAGWFCGAGKPVHIYIPEWEKPELMYKMANSISFNKDELLRELSK